MHASFETNLVTISCLSHLFERTLASATLPRTLDTTNLATTPSPPSNNRAFLFAMAYITRIDQLDTGYQQRAFSNAAQQTIHRATFSREMNLNEGSLQKQTTNGTAEQDERDSRFHAMHSFVSFYL